MWLHRLCQNTYYAGSIESLYCVKSNDIEKMCEVTHFLLRNIMCVGLLTRQSTRNHTAPLSKVRWYWKFKRVCDLQVVLNGNVNVMIIQGSFCPSSSHQNDFHWISSIGGVCVAYWRYISQTVYLDMFNTSMMSQSCRCNLHSRNFWPDQLSC